PRSEGGVDERQSERPCRSMRLARQRVDQARSRLRQRSCAEQHPDQSRDNGNDPASSDLHALFRPDQSKGPASLQALVEEFIAAKDLAPSSVRSFYRNANARAAQFVVHDTRRSFSRCGFPSNVRLHIAFVGSSNSSCTSFVSSKGASKTPRYRGSWMKAHWFRAAATVIASFACIAGLSSALAQRSPQMQFRTERIVDPQQGGLTLATIDVP